MKKSNKIRSEMKFQNLRNNSQEKNKALYQRLKKRIPTKDLFAEDSAEDLYGEVYIYLHAHM
jgi:hypothetical protein